ncbi:MAG TPA: PQQ-binding-like beta-propeller repeat protein [Pirellulales bacterium]|jgi:outer membrane protein assembly factor BamB
MRLEKLAVLFCLIGCLTSPARICHADDSAAAGFANSQMANWHQWRGPLSNGIAPQGDPPTTWDENTNVRWKVTPPGEGSSTPIIWDDKIFLLTAIPTDREVELPAEPEKPVVPSVPGAPAPRRAKRPSNVHQFVVLCLDRATGNTLWQHVATEQVPHEGHHPDHGYASFSPTTDGQHLYVSFGSRGIFCYDLGGRQVWNRDLGDMETYASFGEGTSPVIHNDSLIVNWDHQGESFLIVLDARTGETRWKVDREPVTSWATPLVVEYEGRTQLIVNGTKRVRSYDLKTGEVIWECGGQVSAAIPCPVTYDGLVYCMTGFRGSALYAIPLSAHGDITDSEHVAWHKHQGTPYVPSPLLYGDLLYFTGSNAAILSCLDAKTGDEVFERQRLQGLKNIYASPVGAAERIYIAGRDGVVMVLKHGRQLEVLTTNTLEDGFDASPAIVGRQLFLRGKMNLYCLEAK